MPRKRKQIEEEVNQSDKTEIELFKLKKFLARHYPEALNDYDADDNGMVIYT